MLLAGLSHFPLIGDDLIADVIDLWLKSKVFQGFFALNLFFHLYFFVVIVKILKNSQILSWLCRRVQT